MGFTINIHPNSGYCLKGRNLQGKTNIKGQNITWMGDICITCLLM